MEEAIVVKVENLSHKYSVQWAVKDVSFNITGKGVMGLLGSNGAGKSTTMNIICGVLNQTEGDVFINGINLKDNPVEAKKNIGFLPQKPPLHADLTVEEYLTHCAYLRLMHPKDVPSAVDVALEKCAITHFRHRLIKNLSGGYQQRVGIAQAIVHNPKFVVLDEPTNGLDPNQIVDIRNLIRSIAEHHAVLLSTHILSEIQAICNEIKMIENGELVFSGTMEEFDNYLAPPSFIIEFNNGPDKDKIAAMSKNKGVEELTIDNLNRDNISADNMSADNMSTDNLSAKRYRIFFDEDVNITEYYIEQSVLNNWDLKELTVERSSLDEIFAQLSGKSEIVNKK